MIEEIRREGMASRGMTAGPFRLSGRSNYCCLAAQYVAWRNPDEAAPLIVQVKTETGNSAVPDRYHVERAREWLSEPW